MQLVRDSRPAAPPASNGVVRLRVCDAPVDAVEMQRATELVCSWIDQGRQGYVVAMNPEKVYALRQAPRLREACEQAALVVPDGIGVVFAARLLHRVRLSRVPGADLMESLCRRAAARGYRVFFYGGQEAVSRQAVGELVYRYPGLQVVGRANGFLSEAAQQQLVERINASRADVVFVALGTPRQEEWIHAHRSRLNASVLMGVGGTLDTITGHVRRAPGWVQRIHLEWLYRLLRQPTRAGRQLRLIRFLCEVAAAKARRGR